LNLANNFENLSDLLNLYWEANVLIVGRQFLEVDHMTKFTALGLLLSLFCWTQPSIAADPDDGTTPASAVPTPQIIACKLMPTVRHRLVAPLQTVTPVPVRGQGKVKDWAIVDWVKAVVAVVVRVPVTVVAVEVKGSGLYWHYNRSPRINDKKSKALRMRCGKMKKTCMERSRPCKVPLLQAQVQVRRRQRARHQQQLLRGAILRDR
jgi:hypothetical protein